MNRIDIQFVPAASMRYETWGDWWFDGETLHIRSVSDDPECDPFLVAFHELVEAKLCIEAGVPQEAVDAFDFAFVAPADDPDAEPGDAISAPYRVQHRAAMLLEMHMAFLLGKTDYGTIR